VGDNSAIEWTDATWNPMLGCTKVSPGCDECYAILTARIRESNPTPKIAAAFAGLVRRDEAGALDWTGRINLLPDRLDQPLRWRKPRRIFVNSQSDLFHKAVPNEFIARVFAIMAGAQRHTFQILTKRPGRMRSLLNHGAFWANVYDIWRTEFGGSAANDWRKPLPNVWLGVSVENQQWADIRIPALLDTPAAVRFLSCEPLLGPVCLDPWHTPHDTSTTPCGGPPASGLHWVIVGGESGRGARPMHPDWARSLVRQCRAAGVPVHVKQMGSVWAKAHGGPSKGGDSSLWPNELRVRQFPEVVPA
jgi:protein gp37